MTNINEPKSFKKDRCQEFEIRRLVNIGYNWEKTYISLVQEIMKNIKEEIKNQNDESSMKDEFMSVKFEIFSYKEYSDFSTVVLRASVDRPDWISTPSF